MKKIKRKNSKKESGRGTAGEELMGQGNGFQDKDDLTPLICSLGGSLSTDWTNFLALSGKFNEEVIEDSSGIKCF